MKERKRKFKEKEYAGKEQENELREGERGVRYRSCAAGMTGR